MAKKSKAEAPKKSLHKLLIAGSEFKVEDIIFTLSSGGGALLFFKVPAGSSEDNYLKTKLGDKGTFPVEVEYESYFYDIPSAYVNENDITLINGKGLQQWVLRGDGWKVSNAKE